MFKTIFSKLVAIFVIVLLVAFLITGIMLNIFMYDYVTDEKAKNFEESCDNVNLVLSGFMKDPGNVFAEAYLKEFLKVYSGYTRSMIWIVDQKGYIWQSSTELPSDVQQLYRDESGFIRLADKRQYDEVINGSGKIRVIGDFYGFFSNPSFKNTFQDVKWLTVAQAYDYYNSNGQKFKIAIYMHTPVPEVNKLRDEVLKLFLISCLVALLISVILIYFFSLKLSKPIKQINNVAKIIADGEFSKRLNIDSQDEIGELAKTFNQMIVALQNLEEMRKGFIANVSHELRTPMTTIRGFIEGILDGTIPEEKQSYYLQIVKEETIRLNRLINNLLDLSKMESGDLKLNIQSVDINETIRKCIIKLEALILEKNIQVEAQFEEESVYALADLDAIERVLYNLLHNAIKFSPIEGKISISVKKVKDKIHLSVSDNGLGIDSNELDMIWERFYKSDKSRSDDKIGTGLGLSIVKNIISEHGQDIWVESELGKGTTFTFTLDRADYTPDA